jgi:hypothetical protein
MISSAGWDDILIAQAARAPGHASVVLMAGSGGENTCQIL